jgi:hypothetical protein
MPSAAREPSAFASQNPTGPSTESSGSMPERIASRADSTGFCEAVARAYGVGPMAVRDGLNDRSIGITSIVAAQAELVAREKRLRGMRLMTIQAMNPSRMHAAAEKRRELVVLFAHLAVCVIRVCVIQGRECKVVQEAFARMKVTCEFAAARVTVTVVTPRNAGLRPSRRSSITGRAREIGMAKPTFCADCEKRCLCQKAPFLCSQEASK